MAKCQGKEALLMHELKWPGLDRGWTRNVQGRNDAVVDRCAKFQRGSWWIQPQNLSQVEACWLLTRNAAKAFENALYIVIGLVLWPDALTL